MDERDYKAMNEELKSAESILGKNTGMTFDEETYLIQTHFEYVIKSMEEYASQFQKQLKEKEEEIERLRSSLFTSERFRMEDAATSIDDRNILHAQLTKSNEMNDRLAESLRKLSSQEHIEQELYYRMINDAFDILEQYQNSKK